MSLSAAVLDALAASGVSREQIIAAVKADIAEREAEAAAKLEAKRAGNRDRQRRKRNGQSRNVTPVTRDERDTPPVGSPKEDNQTPSLPPATPNVISSEITPPAEIQLKPEHVIEAWNDLAARHGLALVKKMTPERRRKLNTFIIRHTIDDITEAIAAIPRSPFLLGQNGRGWRASFDWFLEPRNLTKLTEQTYVH